MVFTSGYRCHVLLPGSCPLPDAHCQPRGAPQPPRWRPQGKRAEERGGQWEGAQAGLALAPCSDSAGMSLSRLPEGRERSREARLRRKDHRGPREKYKCEAVMCQRKLERRQPEGVTHPLMDSSVPQKGRAWRQQTALLGQFLFRVVFLPLPPSLRRKDSFALQKQIKRLPECSTAAAVCFV